MKDNSTAQLVERLRDDAKAYSGMLHDAHAACCREAADLIEALTRVQPSTSSVEALWLAIKHGDEDHQVWLKEALTAFFAGEPIPEPRGKGNKEARIAELEAQLSALPPPEREPLREALANARAYVALGSIYARKLGEMEVVREAGEMLAEIDALLAPPPAQSGDRT